jgi:hypothetical protein
VQTGGIIFQVIALALFIGYRRLTSAKIGEPQEDERFPGEKQIQSLPETGI